MQDRQNVAILAQITHTNTQTQFANYVMILLQTEVGTTPRPLKISNDEQEDITHSE